MLIQHKSKIIYEKELNHTLSQIILTTQVKSHSKQVYNQGLMESQQVSLSQLHQVENSSADTQEIKRYLTWKQLLRSQRSYKPIKTKPIHRFSESQRSKNIPKNVTKTIISLITTTNIYDSIIEDKDSLIIYLNKHREVQNLEKFLRLCKQHWNPRINKIHMIFRKICYRFIRKDYISYVFNSKIKDPQWHIHFRNELIEFLRQL